jgi:UDP-N-acetylmuramoyl-tripeptide--D-alanyl-D-alanine ligase
MAHLDGFGGFEGVKKGKAELYTCLKNNHGIAFINKNNPYLLEMSVAADLDKIIYYGTESTDGISGKLIKTDPLIEISWSDKVASYQTSVNLTGSYNFENILAAICIGAFFDVTPSAINKGLAGYYPNNNRSQITKTENNTVICDFYNANPSSMTAALNNISLLTADKKTVIIGDMFELGPESTEQHDLIAKQAEQLNVETLVFIGKDFYALKDKYKGHFFNTRDEAQEFLKTNPIRNSLVLLKGSRGMALEQLLPLL